MDQGTELTFSRRTFVSLPALAAAPAARRSRAILAAAWPVEKLARTLAAREAWKPFPTAADRQGWEKLPAEVRTALAESGARHLGQPWPVLPATVFLEYRRVGNRSRYERLRSERREKLRELVIAECAEAKGRFLDEIVNGLWATCEETFWGVPAHLGAQKAGTGLPDVNEPIVDLFAAETASLLAWTHYLLAPQLAKVSPLAPERIRTEIARRVLEPNRTRTDFGWMGLRDRDHPVNNWNPWINSNWLTCELLMEPDAARRAQAVHKILLSLDVFLDGYHDDGGCDEGPGYWGRAGASLFDCLELLYSASGGAMDFYGVPLVREIGRYIYRAHINDDWYVNFADASARLRPSGDLIFRYGRRIADEKMQALGAFAARSGSGGDSIGRQLPALFNAEALHAAKAYQPLVRDAWLAGIQVMAARSKEGSTDGLYLAAQGGHNAESHNHNDVGNFIVFANGKPAIIDVGVETYTAKTFSSRRYEIWTMQSAYHNLPTIGGVMQGAGRQYQASAVEHRADSGSAQFRLDIAKAYPAEAGVESWVRTLRLDRARNEITVEENYRLRQAVPQITLTLMTPRAPRISGGVVRLDDVRVEFDKALSARSEEIKLEDGRLRGAWGERLYRILLVAEHPPAAGGFKVSISC
ncbi:MAG: heparinase II/III family protein [Bryobacteraceae bacterium]